MKVAWVGLGTMGLQMALCAQSKGIDVLPVLPASGRGHAGTKAFADETGIDPVMTLPANIGILAMCLPSEDETLAVLESFSGNLPDRIVDFSTMSPTAARNFDRQLADKGHQYVDAPISGSVEMARDGKLTIFCGTSMGRCPLVDELISALSGNPSYFENTGSGASVKLVNQVMHLANMVGLRLGAQASAQMGLDFDAVVKALVTASASSAMLLRFGSKIARDDLSPHFKIALARKDLRLVAQAALLDDDPIFAAISQAYSDAETAFGPDVNFSAVAAFSKLSDDG